jgi:hypothetical protein
VDPIFIDIKNEGERQLMKDEQLLNMTRATLTDSEKDTLVFSDEDEDDKKSE